MASRDFRTRLLRRAGRTNVFLSDTLASQLTAYYELLIRWNRKINLTSIENPDEAVDRLLLEPVIAARQIPAVPGRLMDIGSGGGSPAIPLALACPFLQLTMVEVKARKSAFLREAVRELALPRAVVEAARYEELLARPELHETSSVLSLRAVRVETRTLTSLQAFLAVGGLMLLFRGPRAMEASESVVPPLAHAGTFPLVESLQSRLTVLRKMGIGRC